MARDLSRDDRRYRDLFGGEVRTRCQKGTAHRNGRAREKTRAYLRIFEPAGFGRDNYVVARAALCGVAQLETALTMTDP